MIGSYAGARDCCGMLPWVCTSQGSFVRMPKFRIEEEKKISVSKHAPTWGDTCALETVPPL